MWRRTGGSLSGCCAFGGALVFYAWSLAPGIEYWDTGEMQTDANALFVAHPTGFPLFMLGGWVFAHVFALGDPAWRISLFAAIAAAFAAAMLACFVYELTRDAVVAGVAGLGFATVDVVWETAVRADPHDLALACSALALVLAARAGRERDLGLARLSALAFGAALAAHPVALFVAPGLLALAWPALLPATYRALAGLAAAALAPLVLYAYIPIRSLTLERAGADPSVVLGLAGSALVDDGAPSTPHAFAHYLLATRFAPQNVVAELSSPGGLGHVAAFAHALAYEAYGYLALALGLVGMGVLAVRTPRIALALGLSGAGAVGFAASYSIEAAPERYALAALFALSVCIAYGAWWLGRSVVETRYATALGVGLLGLAVIPSLPAAAQRVHARALRGDARSEADRIARFTHDGSVIVSAWTFATPLAYARYVAVSFGTRRVVSGWPADYDGFYASWRKRYGHVYFIVDGKLAAGHDFGPTLFRAPHGTYVLSEYAPK